jgi:hypothetical protein
MAGKEDERARRLVNGGKPQFPEGREVGEGLFVDRLPMREREPEPRDTPEGVDLHGGVVRPLRQDLAQHRPGLGRQVRGAVRMRQEEAGAPKRPDKAGRKLGRASGSSSGPTIPTTRAKGARSRSLISE